MGVIPYYMGRWGKCLNDCKAPLCPHWYKERGFCGRYNCQWCGGWIKTGSPAVRVSYYKTRKVSDVGAIEKGIKPEQAFIAYHLECYKKQHSAWLDNWFIKHPRKTKARGRPKKYKDGKAAHKLKVQLRQYELAGNLAKVVELESKIKELEV